MMQTPEPSFIQIGDKYFATIKINGVEDVIKEGGKNKPFDSATRAMNHAVEILKPRTTATIAETPRTPNVVDEWRTQRAREYHRGYEIVNLIGVEVVTKKRRTIRK